MTVTMLGDDEFFGGWWTDAKNVVKKTGSSVASNVKRAAVQTSRGNFLTAAKAAGSAISAPAVAVGNAVNDVILKKINRAIGEKAKTWLFDKMISAGEASLDSAAFRSNVIQQATTAGTGIGAAAGTIVAPGVGSAIGAGVGAVSFPLAVAGAWTAIKGNVKQELKFRKAKADSAAKAVTVKTVAARPINPGSAGSAGIGFANRSAVEPARPINPGVAAASSMGMAAHGAVEPKKFNPLLLAIPVVALLVLKGKK